MPGGKSPGRSGDLIVAVTFAAAVGDVTRFDSLRHLMGYLGLVPSERSTGASVRRGGITKAGNSRVCHMRVESAWKAQSRLTARYRRLTTTGKRTTVVCTAIARELAGFMWSVGRVAPTI